MFFWESFETMIMSSTLGWHFVDVCLNLYSSSMELRKGFWNSVLLETLYLASFCILFELFLHILSLCKNGNSICKKNKRHQAQAHSLIRSFTAILLPRCLNLWGFWWLLLRGGNVLLPGWLGGWLFRQVTWLGIRAAPNGLWSYCATFPASGC